MLYSASQFGDNLVSRNGASPNFSALDFYFTRYQTLFGNFSAKIAMASGTASGPLYTSQQFYLGGATFGRGYGAAEISGDNGLAGSFELRFDQRPNFRYLAGYRLYAFVDTGAVWNDGYRIGDGLALSWAAVFPISRVVRSPFNSGPFDQSRERRDGPEGALAESIVRTRAMVSCLGRVVGFGHGKCISRALRHD